MNFIVQHFLPILIPALAGYITNIVMNYTDDVLKLTAKLPDAAKQGLVIVIAALVTTLNQQYGWSLPSDIGGLLSQPSVQTIVAAALAFFVKAGQSKKAAVAAGK